ncbi:MAG: transglutaminaseTgpA domain-containing protein, partial [Myxococcota bacterium]|nr:transglutaminaseTgpA domain-containing protein [Myxococcota bacterium]
MSAVAGRLGQQRRRVVAALVFTGLAACATAGGAAALVAGTGAMGVIVGHVRERHPDTAALRRWRAANLLALVGCALMASLVPSTRLVVGLGLVAWLQVHRAWTGRSPGDARVTLLLSLLLILLACILTVSAWLAPLFLVAAVLTPIALLLVHLEEAAASQRSASGGARGAVGTLWMLAPASLVLTVAFFAGIPRMDGAGVGGRDGGSDMAGFGQDVELGDLGAILDNPDVVMRARVRSPAGVPLEGPFYFRGVALDHFDGRRWTHTLGGEVRLS